MSTFKEYLEKWVFDETELKKIKQKLQNQGGKSISKNEILTLILEYLAHIYENLQNFLPFYFDHIVAQNELHVFSEQENDSENNKFRIIQNQLKEREELLELVAQRIRKISNKIAKK